jgi:uncharacterized repeat protein (TIGR01451 family)
LAVLAVGAAMILSWIPVGVAQTGDPPPGPVIAQTQTGTPPKPELTPGPRQDKGEGHRSVASSAAPGVEAKPDRPAEKPTAFRRIETAEPAWPVPPSRPIAASPGALTPKEPAPAQGPILTPAAPLPLAPALAVPGPAVLVTAPVPAPRLRLVVQAPERVAVGDAVPFTLLVTNGGIAPLADVTVRDRLPAGLQHPEGDYLENDLGTLAPGESKKLELQALAIRAGAQINQAEALARDGTSASATATVLVEETSALLLRQAGPDRPYLGRPSDYRLEVVNRGKTEAHGVQVQVRLPAGLEFVAADSGGGYDVATRTVQWGLGTMPAEHSLNLMLRLLPRLPGAHVPLLLARSAEGQEARLEAPLQVQAVQPAALQLRMVGPEAALTVGKEMVYEVHVANSGMTALKGVQLAALLPAGVVPRRGDGPTASRVQGQEVVFAPLPRLAPRTQVVYRIRVQGGQAGMGPLRVRLIGDPSGVPLFRDYNVLVVGRAMAEENLRRFGGTGRLTDQQLNNR